MFVEVLVVVRGRGCDGGADFGSGFGCEGGAYILVGPVVALSGQSSFLCCRGCCL